MAVPTQPAHALDVGEVWRRAPAVPSPPPTDHSPHLGRLATSHINGRAGWWKSPSPDLARGRGGQPPGLLYSVSRLSLLLGPAVPLCPELCCSPPLAPAGRGHTQGFRLYSRRRYVSSLVVVGLRRGNSI